MLALIKKLGNAHPQMANSFACTDASAPIKPIDGRGFYVKERRVRKIHRRAYITLIDRPLHCLDFTNLAAGFETLILGKIFFPTLFARRRNHSCSFDGLRM